MLNMSISMSKPLYETVANNRTSPNDFDALKRRMAAKTREREAYRQFAEQQTAEEARGEITRVIKELKEKLGITTIEVGVIS